MNDKAAMLVKAVEELEGLEKTSCNVALVFAEMFKDEVNANDEIKLYNGMKRVLKKYSADKGAISALDEFTGVLTGGASLREILTISREEVLSPTAATDISVDNGCRHGGN
ncbi:MAG TPA: hypothetical protein VHR42_09875 [Clostridia bacterium]|nr:hypothetical protein [Clostridia bacterium]